MKISIIIVNYNNEDLIKKNFCFLNKSKDIQVIVVNNSNKELELSDSKVINNQNNLGFAKACNQGIKITKGHYILLINPDIQINEPLDKLISYMEKNKEVGILAPKLLNKDKSLQYSCRRFPKLKSQICHRLFPKSKVVDDYLMKDFDHESIKEIDWSLGAFLLIRKEVFRDIGLFDERFFLYYEDVDFCLRAKKAGWKTVYYPFYEVIHLHKQESRKYINRAFFEHFKSMFKFYKKHGWGFKG
ncbi:MAG: glycosyltransferase family 2 protein [archaeon]